MWRETHFQVKMLRTPQVRTTLDAEMPKKCTVLWHKAHFQVNMYKAHQLRNTFGTTSARRRGVKQFSKSKCTKHNIFRALFEVRMSLPFCQRWVKRVGFAAVEKTMAGVGHLKRICNDAFCVAGAIQETCSADMFRGQGTDFLRRVAFWSSRSSGLLRWFCVTGAALRMTWPHFFVAGALF